MQDFYDRKPVCAVTEHKVFEVAERNPELFMQGGEINIPRVLFYLGFDIRSKDDIHNYNYTVQEDFRIRSSKYPRKCYATKVYSGDVRNAVKVVNGQPVFREGKPVFDKERLHAMAPVYEGGAVLQADDIDKFVTPDMLMDISEIGSNSKRKSSE